MNLHPSYPVFVGAIAVLAFVAWGDIFPSEDIAPAAGELPPSLTSAMFEGDEHFAPSRNPFAGEGMQMDASGYGQSGGASAGAVEGAVLQGILSSGGFRAAIISGEVYMEGDSGPIGAQPPKWTLRRVAADAALFQAGGRLVEVEVESPGAWPEAAATAEAHQP